MTKLAVVFPGQGSQSVGMIADIYNQYPQVATNFKAASVILGYDLWDIIVNNPDDKLNSTEYTQVALLVASYSIWQLLQAQLPEKPVVLAGHSLGEYTALLCAGSISFAEAVELVALRGQLMQQAVPKDVGAMAAILGLDDQQVTAVCSAINAPDQIVAAANFNSPGQVVISGHKTAVVTACAELKQLGAKRTLMLPVSVPAHCALMQEVVVQLQEQLKTMQIAAPSIAVLHNVDVASHNSATAISAALIAQLFSSVRWVDTINAFSSYGVSTVLECGPGAVLTGLNKRINRDLNIMAINSVAAIEELTICN